MNTATDLTQMEALELLRPGDVVLATISTDRAYVAVVLEPMRTTFVVDRLQPAVLLQYVITPETVSSSRTARPVGSTGTGYARAQDLQAW